MATYSESQQRDLDAASGSALDRDNKIPVFLARERAYIDALGKRRKVIEGRRGSALINAGDKRLPAEWRAAWSAVADYCSRKLS